MPSDTVASTIAADLSLSLEFVQHLAQRLVHQVRDRVVALGTRAPARNFEPGRRPELHIKLQEGENHALIEKLRTDSRFTAAQDIITLDGLRVEYTDGFGLMRASNTTPVIVLRFEADDADALTRIQQDFRRVLLDADAGLQLPF